MTRPFGAALLCVSLLLLAVSGWQMAVRVAAFHRQMAGAGPTVFDFDRAFARSITFDAGPFRGRTLTLTDTWIGDPDDPRRRRPGLIIDWDGTRTTIPVIAPLDRAGRLSNMDGLEIYEESLAVLSFVPIVDGRRLPADADHLRMVVVARRTDFDPDTWGAVRVRDWVFQFVELRADGTLWPPPDQPPRLMQFRDRRGRLPAEVIAREELAAAGPGTPVPPLPPAGPRLTSVEPIEERTWEWQAALHALPKGQVSRYRFQTTAVSAMGWTLPTAGLAVLGVLAGLALLLSTIVRRARA
jgi:hypothetical protein